MDYPKYYLVEDIPVKLIKINEEIQGENYLGNPYPIGKAIIDGMPISQDDFNRLAKSLAA